MANANWAELYRDAAAGGGSFEPLPDGDYDLKVEDASHTLTQGGKTMFKLTAVVQTGPHANRKVFDNLVVSPDSAPALGFFFRKMKALGLDNAFFAQQPNEDVIVSNMRGKTFRGKLATRSYNDKLSNEIKEYHPAVGGLGAPSFAAAPAPAAGGVVPGVAPAAPAPAPAPAVAPAPAPAPAYEAPAVPAAPAPAAPPAPASPWEGAAAPAAPALAPGGFAAPPAPPF